MAVARVSDEAFSQFISYAYLGCILADNQFDVNVQ